MTAFVQAPEPLSSANTGTNLTRLYEQLSKKKATPEKWLLLLGYMSSVDRAGRKRGWVQKPQKLYPARHIYPPCVFERGRARDWGLRRIANRLDIPNALRKFRFRVCVAVQQCMIIIRHSRSR
jgi:hypothetical protein